MNNLEGSRRPPCGQHLNFLMGRVYQTCALPAGHSGGHSATVPCGKPFGRPIDGRVPPTVCLLPADHESPCVWHIEESFL